MTETLGRMDWEEKNTATDHNGLAVWQNTLECILLVIHCIAGHFIAIKAEPIGYYNGERDKLVGTYVHDIFMGMRLLTVR